MQGCEHMPQILQWMAGVILKRVCQGSGIEHRLTKPYRPWTNGQAERMVRAIKVAPLKSFQHISIIKLRRRVRNRPIDYAFVKHLTIEWQRYPAGCRIDSISM